MQLLRLIILYLAYMSVGVSDSLLGAAWPGIYKELNVSVSYAGIISMIIAIGTIISNLCSFRFIKALGYKRVIEISFVLTALSLAGFSMSDSFPKLCVCAIPYGLGIGTISSSLIKYVALYYKSRHMSWLHCSWGIGATVGPSIMGLYLLKQSGWQEGYMTVSIVHFALITVLLLSSPWWKRTDKNMEAEKSQRSLKIADTFKIAGAKEFLLAFFAYSSLEALTGLWASSYLVLGRGLNAQRAASLTSLFYLGITTGRFFSGFIVNKTGDKMIIRIGQGIILTGILFLLLPYENYIVLIGLLMIGMGCAPIYPGMLHATPDYFGVEISQALLGIQLASAYIGSTFIPPLFGWIVGYGNIKILYPVLLTFLMLIMIFSTEQGNKRIKLRQNLIRINSVDKKTR